MSYLLTCQRAFRAYLLMCQRALCAYVPTCLTCLRAHVTTSLVCFRGHVPTCLSCLCAHVPTCLTCLRGHVPCVPNCSCGITSNNKNKFSMTCFTYIFGTFSLSFLWKIKLYMNSIYGKQECLWKHLLSEFSSTFRTFSYQAEAFNGCYNKLCTIKWFDLCLSRTLNFESYF